MLSSYSAYPSCIAQDMEKYGVSTYILDWLQTSALPFPTRDKDNTTRRNAADCACHRVDNSGSVV